MIRVNNADREMTCVCAESQIQTYFLIFVLIKLELERS